jgi:membrane protein YqaA with SNARE-associated domain
MARLKDFLLAFGIPGLLLIAFLDSAAVPMAGGPDAVVMLLAWQSPARAAWIVLAAAVGSMLGCLVLQQIGRRGGDLALARFSAAKRERVKRMLARNDLWAVLLAVLGPPPFPTKVLILAAGVIRMNRIRFALGVFFGRCVRYGGEAYLGIRFGEQAAAVLKQQYPAIAAVLAAFVALWVAAHYFRRRREA